MPNDRRSGSAAVDSYGERLANLVHPKVAEATYPVDQNSYRNAFDRVEVHGSSTSHRIITGFQDDFAGEPAKRRCAWSNQHAPQSGNCRVSGEYDHGPTAYICRFTPPQLAAQRKPHVAAAATRNEARSPHSSGSSSGCSS